MEVYLEKVRPLQYFKYSGLRWQMIGKVHGEDYFRYRAVEVGAEHVTLYLTGMEKVIVSQP